MSWHVKAWSIYFHAPMCNTVCPTHPPFPHQSPAVWFLLRASIQRYSDCERNYANSFTACNLYSHDFLDSSSSLPHQKWTISDLLIPASAPVRVWCWPALTRSIIAPTYEHSNIDSRPISNEGFMKRTKGQNKRCYWPHSQDCGSSIFVTLTWLRFTLGANL